MISNGMMICSFYLKSKFKRNTDEIYALNSEFCFKNDEFEEKNFTDVFDMLQMFCSEQDILQDFEKDKKVFAINQNKIKIHDEESFRAISFIIQSGSYGIEAEMTDRITKVINYHRTEDEADVKEFHCVIYVPKDADEINVKKGIIVFQTIATYGVKIIIVKQMKKFFSGIGLTLNIRNVSVRAFIEKLIDKGNLHKMTFIKNNISCDDSDNLFINTGREEKTYIKPMFKENALNKILSLFDNADKQDVYEIPDEYDCDDISMTFDIDSRKRTIRLKNLDRMSIVEDIPDSIFKQIDPEASLVKHMIETADNYKDKMVFEID